jgi:hypothetical protein
VLGQALANAHTEEARRKTTPHGPSPLNDIAYSAEAGDHDLFGFAASPIDSVLREIVTGSKAGTNEARGETRSNLSLEDFYTLLTFAQRAALLTLRGEGQAWTRAGLQAVALIELERVDWRDVLVAVGLLAYAAHRVHSDVSSILTEAAHCAEPAVAQLLMSRAEAPGDGLAVGGFRELQTAAGVALAQDDGEPFHPTADLLRLAESMVAAFEADDYRVSGVTVGSNLPDVWLAGGDDGHVPSALADLTGCVSLRAAPRGGVTANPSAQMLLAFIGETGSDDAAHVLASAARARPGSTVAEFGVCRGRVFVIVVARSFVKDVADFETTESLSRFRDPMQAIIHS